MFDLVLCKVKKKAERLRKRESQRERARERGVQERGYLGEREQRGYGKRKGESERGVGKFKEKARKRD